MQGNKESGGRGRRRGASTNRELDALHVTQALIIDAVSRAWRRRGGLIWHLADISHLTFRSFVF